MAPVAAGEDYSQAAEMKEGSPESARVEGGYLVSRELVLVVTQVEILVLVSDCSGLELGLVLEVRVLSLYLQGPGLARQVI